jgi:MFS family permease
MQSVAQQWVVYEMTGSKFVLGAVTFANTIPTVMLMLPAGVLADRLPRRTILVFTQTTMMLLAFCFAVLLAAGKLEVWHVFVLAACLGLANALDAPARQAFAVEMVEDRGDLFNAIALNSTIFNLARVIGPAVSGLILAQWGAVWCFFLNGISFLAVLAGLLLMKLRPVVMRKAAKPIRQVWEGLQYVSVHPVILPLMLVAGISTLFAFSYSSLLPAFAVEVLSVGEQGLGFLTAAVGLGALMGSLVVAGFSRTRHQGRLFRLGSMIFPLFVFLFAISKSYALSLGLLGIVGFGFVVQNASINTIIQSRISDELRGRVMSIYLLAFFGGTPFGALLVGWLAQQLGTSAGVAVGALTGWICVMGVFLSFPTIRRL